MQFPVEILLEILAKVGAAELATLCRVSKTLCRYSRDALYRDIVDPTNTNAYDTLIRAPHLACRVKSFYLAPCREVSTFGKLSHQDKAMKMNQVLRNLTNLQTLNLDVPCVQVAAIFPGCAFRLRSFSSHLPVDDALVDFLSRQPLIEELTLYGILLLHNICFTPEIVPNLTKITAYATVIKHLIRGRPVCDVTVLPFAGLPVDADFLLTSTVPVHTLSVDSSILRSKPFPGEMSTLSALLRLTVHVGITELQDDNDGARSFMAWMASLVASLPKLHEFVLRVQYPLDIHDTAKFLPLLERMAEGPFLRRLAVTNHQDDLISWRRIDGKATFQRGRF